MRTIIAGSRHIDNFDALTEAIETAKIFEGIEITQVLSGNAFGVDKMGERWAAEQSIPCKLFPANWAKIGAMAGFQRKARAVVSEEVDLFKA